MSDDQDALVASLNETIRDIHALGRTAPATTFKARALELVEGAIPFDTAMWGTGPAAAKTLHDVYLHRQPARIVDAYTAGFRSVDLLRNAAYANPGTTIDLFDLIEPQAWRQTRIYRDFARLFGIECALCTAQVDGPSGLISFVSLWRRNARRTFTDRDRQRKQLMMPHLLEAFTAHRTWHLREKLASWDRGRAMAVFDEQGVVHQSLGGFVALMNREWPRWSGKQLPRMLIQHLTGEAEFKGRRTMIRSSPFDSLRLLEVRARREVDKLTGREREVALLYARGEPYTTIAQTLQLSGATVRNQIARIYRKLDVGNKAELARRLRIPDDVA
jgi:DNA-binding CsgD family transcriptional regulator